MRSVFYNCEWNVVIVSLNISIYVYFCAFQPALWVINYYCLCIWPVDYVYLFFLYKCASFNRTHSNFEHPKYDFNIKLVLNAWFALLNNSIWISSIANRCIEQYENLPEIRSSISLKESSLSEVWMKATTFKALKEFNNEKS